MKKSLKETLHLLSPLSTALKIEKSPLLRCQILRDFTIKYRGMTLPAALSKEDFSLHEETVLLAIVAIEQDKVLFPHKNLLSKNGIATLLEQLILVEQCYRHLGGIVGYHCTSLRLLDEQRHSTSNHEVHYLPPKGISIQDNTPQIDQWTAVGIKTLPKLALFSPVGGACERLEFIDETCSVHLPAALLPFQGSTLLGLLISDVKAYEYLYFKLFGKQIEIPICLMTSGEKDNHTHLQNLLKKNNWYGCPPSQFLLFSQPQVPLINDEGDWVMEGPLKLSLKPGGHGMLWTLAKDHGILSKLKERGCTVSIARQINNPLAFTDQGVLPLIGYGIKKDKKLGFLSCPRPVGAAEGINVIIERQEKGLYHYILTNIEYTDFIKKGIQEKNEEGENGFSPFPSNTNIFFITLETIEEALAHHPIPNPILNMKSKETSSGPDFGESKKVGRMESTMQNIADGISTPFSQRMEPDRLAAELPTFLMFGKREKTISATKKKFKQEQPPSDTPQKAYYDLLKNHYDLFKEHCSYTLPDFSPFEEYLKNGPTCTILFHPALGPLYTVIKQKIFGGKISQQSELVLNIAELELVNLTLSGSLIIESKTPLGRYNSQGHTLFSLGGGSCSLRNVSVQNLGILEQSGHRNWSGNFDRKEEVKIILHEGAQFDAEGVTLNGPHLFEVAPHHHLKLVPDTHHGWKEQLTKIKQPLWHWDYQFDEKWAIRLKKIIH